MATLDDRKYSKDHEWVLLEPEGTALVGITQFAQDELGDVVFVELPKVGSQTQQFQRMGEVESVKAVSDLIAPIAGEVVEINPDLALKPQLLNEDPYGKGWLVRVRPADPAEMDNLLESAQYDAHTGQ